MKQVGNVLMWASIVCCLWAATGEDARGQSVKKDNIVLFLSDDHGIAYSSAYGMKQIRTPNMKRLTEEGMLFSSVFTATAMCSPSRSMLYTGLYPHRNGGHRNHSVVYPEIESLPDYLSKHGYRVALAGKRHIGPADAFPFEYFSFDEVDRFLQDVGRDPFVLIIASDEPHTPHESGGYKPGEIKTPPHLVDTPETQRRIANYATDVTHLDQEVGRTLDLLEEHRLADHTLFIYTSDHGAPLPYGKWTLYEAGLHVPFIARWPGKIKAGSSTDALVSFVDVVPTFIEIAGGDVPNELDGKSFLPVLLGHQDTHREYVFGTHTNEGINNGSRYPIRSVSSERYKYIVNLAPHATFTNNITEGGVYAGSSTQEYWQSGENYGSLWKSWVDQALRDLFAAQRTIGYQHRPREELYDLKEDPNELNNLASEPSQVGRLVRMRNKLINWMEHQGDPLLEQLNEITL